MLLVFVNLIPIRSLCDTMIRDEIKENKHELRTT